MSRTAKDKQLAAGIRFPRTGRFAARAVPPGAMALVLLLGMLSACARAPSAPASTQAAAPAASQPATAPHGPVLFQPGVWIDWRRREVHVQGRVVLREGALEFLACLAGKEHESIVRIEAAATHVYLGLGLIGLTPGRPPAWDRQTERYRPSAGDLVDITLVWQHDEQARTADACDWLRETEYARVPASRPWVFAGSLRAADGSLSSDSTGVGIAVADFPDSLLCLSREHTSRNSELWVEANTPAIPPVGTPVRLVLRPARWHARRATLDLRGVLWVDGRYCSAADFADLIGLDRQLDAKFVQTVTIEGALRSDAAAMRRALLAAGVPEDALRFVPDAPRLQSGALR